MPQYLRAFLFDSTQPINTLVDHVFSTWANGDAVAIIPKAQPQLLIDKSIVKCDPNEVLDLTTGQSVIRELAIVETPDLAAVVLTSGTTSDPKPVELSFFSMKSSVDALYRACELGADDTWLCCLPPHYIAGLAIFARCFVSGSQLIFHESFNVQQVKDSLQNNSITAISLVGSQLKKLLDDNVDLTQLKTILVGGSSISPELIEQCAQQNISIHTTYGMTETWGGICHDGILFDNTQARINKDNVIELRSSSLMSGYRHDFASTMSRITSDGWFRTSDRGSFDGQRLRVFGRDDDVINSGGIKIDPEPVEATIRQSFPDHELALCATDHKTYGQCVTLCFLESDSTIPSLETVRKELKDALPSTQIPLQLATVATFPTTASGKIKRKELTELCTVIEQYSQGE